MIPDDARWVRSTANELNNLLQVIGEAGEYLGKVASADPEAARYLEMMRKSIERGVSVTNLMLARIGESRLAPQSKGPAIAGGVLPAATEPVKKEPAGAIETEEIEGIMIANPQGLRELILVVDDEDFVSILAQRMLADDGYKVITARDGFQAVKIYSKLQHRIDLIILDFTMPIMDGSEVFDELRSINPRVPVMLSSGYAEQEKVKSMLAKGLRGFLPKPYTQQKMLSQVRSTLDSIKRERKSS